jgi:radical SAM superfamily enzyme YgiQ (UPF0313 family)
MKKKTSISLVRGPVIYKSGALNNDSTPAIGFAYLSGYLENFWETGRALGATTEKDMPFMASRGCPYQCTFCSSPSMWTTRYIVRDVNDAIEEIKHYIKRFAISSVQFYDLTAITKKTWIVSYCKKLIEEGIQLKWSLPK